MAHYTTIASCWTAQVKVGDVVKAGDRLMILSAMKMETIVTCPCDGKVTTLNALELEAVEQGDLIAFIEK
jgi:biotin carboxyl carrier protein